MKRQIHYAQPRLFGAFVKLLEWAFKGVILVAACSLIAGLTVTLGFGLRSFGI